MTESATIVVGIDGQQVRREAAKIVRSLADIRKAADALAQGINVSNDALKKLSRSFTSASEGLNATTDAVTASIRKSVSEIKAANGEFGNLDKMIRQSGEATRQLSSIRFDTSSVKAYTNALISASTQFDRLVDKSNKTRIELNVDLGRAEKELQKTEATYDKLVQSIKSNLEGAFSFILVWANEFSGAVTTAFAISNVLAFMNFVRETKQTLWTLGPILAGVAGSLLSTLVPAINAVSTAFMSLAAAAWANPIIAVIGVIALAIAGLATYIYRNWDVLKDWGGHFVTLGDVVTSVIEEMSDRVAYWTDLFKVDVKLLVAAVRYQFALMGDFFGAVFDRMAKWIDAFKNHFQDVTTHIGKIWDALWDGNISKASELSNQTIKFNAPDGSFLEDFKNNLKKSFEDIDIGGILRERADIEAKYAHLDGGFTASLDRRLADKAATRAGGAMRKSVNSCQRISALLVRLLPV